MGTKFRAIIGIMVALILSTSLIGTFNTLAVVAESIPTTEILYDWFKGDSFPTPGIYVITTETNPIGMLQNYTNYSAFYDMLKEHVTTQASTEDFISILVSRGMLPNSGYGLKIDSIEKRDYAFVLNATFTAPDPSDWVLHVLTNPTALIPIGNLPAGEYSITLHIQYDDVFMETETWTATFKVSSGWITITSGMVEVSIENKTTVLGEEILMFMVAPMGTTSSSSQIFDVYLYDSNYSLFSRWSQDKAFLTVITTVPPGYNETLTWNLYGYDEGNYFPPPQGNYYLVGVLMGMGEIRDVTPPILIKIDNSTITPIAHQPSTEFQFPVTVDGLEFNVVIESNSTVSNFDFRQGEMKISFSVTGPDGTVGFCNVTIPMDLMTGELWLISIDDIYEPETISISGNGTHTFLYFTYTHTSPNIKIGGTWVVPELPTEVSLLLVLAILAVSTIILKRRTQKHPLTHRLEWAD